MADKGRIQAKYVRDLVSIAGLTVSEASIVFEAAWGANVRAQEHLIELDKDLPPPLRKHANALAAHLIHQAMGQVLELIVNLELRRIVAEALDRAPVTPNKEGQFK